MTEEKTEKIKEAARKITNDLEDVIIAHVALERHNLAWDEVRDAIYSAILSVLRSHHDAIKQTNGDITNAIIDDFFKKLKTIQQAVKI